MKFPPAWLLIGAITGVLSLFSCVQTPKPVTPPEQAEITTSPKELSEHAFYRRAVEAVNWGIPTVNYDLMYQAMVRDAKGAFNQIVYWSQLPDWKIQTLTPNPDVIYFIPFINTKDAGAMVLEIPPADDGLFIGTIMDCWQAPLADVGPAGLDKGKGGKYLILPPNNRCEVPSGYYVVGSDTFESYAFLRSVLRGGSDADIARAVAYGKRIKLYPFAQANKPAATKFVDAAHVVFDSTIPNDIRFFRSLDRIVQNEHWLEKDKVMIDMLKSLGIEKGKPFHPDLNTQKLLEDAVREARAWLEARYEAALVPFNGAGQWSIAALDEFVENLPTFFENTNAYTLDSRGLQYHFIFGSAKHPGTDQFYLITLKDKQGEFLDGKNSYRLNVPAHVPAKQYWSVVIYDRSTHSLFRNLSRPGRSSYSPGLKKNTDGSVDIYFGPDAPAGKELNWVPTNPDGKFEAIFRFYGTEKPLFTSEWKLPDLEKSN
ncbi:MAG: hypothetical protein C5B53_00835 [Candidatus Melainabacteria bacterium]|nr:MAG: hypothetical protein C5B53_00835 [Candidatus Melainabacteria bacterium]